MGIRVTYADIINSPTDLCTELRVDYDSENDRIEIITRLTENFGGKFSSQDYGKRWKATQYTGLYDDYFYLHLYNEDDFMAFKLAWG